MVLTLVALNYTQYNLATLVFLLKQSIVVIMLIEALILGFTQGLTEFIPVSSSGHLLLVSELFGFDSGFSFEVILNIGTLLAAVIYFRRDIESLFRSSKTSARLRSNLIITTIPGFVAGGLIGLVFDDGIRSVLVTSIMLIGVGIVMMLESKLKNTTTKIDRLTKNNSLIIGFAQALALVPGTSRSAATILAGRAVGLGRVEAARYSFLASIPIIAGAVVYESLISLGTLQAVPITDIIIGILAAFVSSVLAIHVLLGFLKRNGLFAFGVYRVIIGALIMILFVQ